MGKFNQFPFAVLINVIHIPKGILGEIANSFSFAIRIAGHLSSLEHCSLYNREFQFLIDF